MDLTKRSFDAFNSKKIPELMGLFTDDAKLDDEMMHMDTKGRKSIEADMKSWHTAFSDAAKIEVHNQFAAGDYVVTLATFHGKNTGDLGKLKKTDKDVALDFAMVSKIRGDKIAEVWRFANGADMMKQLGMMPAMQQGMEPGMPPDHAQPGKQPAKEPMKQPTR